MLKLGLSYFGHIMRKQDSLEKTIMLGKLEGSRKRGRPVMRWTETVKEARSLSLQELSKKQDILETAHSPILCQSGVT